VLAAIDKIPNFSGLLMSMTAEEPLICNLVLHGDDLFR